MFRHAHRRITATRRSRHKYLSHNTSNTGQTAKLKEHQAHLYYKRAATDAVLLGGAEEHRDRVAAMVLDSAAVDLVPWVADGTAV
jgi:hypothetical protein